LTNDNVIVKLPVFLFNSIVVICIGWYVKQIRTHMCNKFSVSYVHMMYCVGNCKQLLFGSTFQYAFEEFAEKWTRWMSFRSITSRTLL